MDMKSKNPAIGGLDDVDQQIIDALRQDGRTPFSQIATQLDVSPGMIRMRYSRLIEMGYLKVVAISNPLQMGFNTMAMIGVRIDGDRLLTAADEISNFDDVIYLVVTSGRYDILVEVMCRDHKHLLDFLTEKLYKVEGVKQSETFVHLKIVKEVYF
ncbi:MAG: Lrp/AsnC family transcriptional regulator [Anaerolineales bacterium]